MTDSELQDSHDENDRPDNKVGEKNLAQNMRKEKTESDYSSEENLGEDYEVCIDYII